MKFNFFARSNKNEIDEVTLKISRLTLAARRAEMILRQTFNQIKIGMSEKEIHNLCHNIVLSSQKSFLNKNKSFGMIKEEFSWYEGACPLVLTNKSFLSEDMHLIPSNERLLNGGTVFLDFGIKLTFTDGKVVCSDLQRVGYATKEGIVPEEIQTLFTQIYSAITFGAKHLKEGTRGYVIDEIVRKEVGFDYKCGTGHGIGENVHEKVGFFPRGLRNKNCDSDALVEKNGVYCIEPRIIKVIGEDIIGISIEEMIKVGERGGEFISPRQEELFIISKEL